MVALPGAVVRETIPHTIDGLNVLGIAWIGFDFGAQVANVDVDGALIAVDAAGTDMFGQIKPGKDPPRRGHERGQQFKFRGCEVDAAAADGDRTTVCI